jgi:outer membrane receptor protein involved in Fe transport
MVNRKSRGILITFFILLPFLVFSQIRNPGVISGRIVDALTVAPIEYANIVLLDSSTKQMVSGVVSDSTGMFRLTDIPFGTYMIDYTFIGYKKQTNGPITVDHRNTRIDIGELRLSAEAINMDEVTITGDRNMMINKIDRKVFNVEKDISAQTGTVTDVLQTIPSLSVDLDGNISLRGSGNITILINGRPSVMAGIANLDQMPASMVERIEIITNPSAKYQPDGTGGIVNIILKKQRKAGFNGVLGANAGNRERFNTNLQLNYNTGKVNIFGSYGFRLDSRRREGELSSQTIDTLTGESVYLDQTSNGSAVPKSHLGQAGFEWDITGRDAVGLSGTFNYRDVNREDETNNIYSDNERITEEEFVRSMDGTESESSGGLTAFYEHVFDREDEHLFRMDFEYETDHELENSSYTTVYTLPVYPNEMERTGSDNRDQVINLALDYTRPVGQKGNLETGYQGNVELTDQNSEVLRWEQDTLQWIPDPEENNSFYGNQTVHAIYFTLSGEWKKFSVMGGLRAEEAIVSLNFRQLDTTTSTRYFALYPTLHLSYNLGKSEWQLNYSRRVNRPDVDEMNPVPEYRDPRNYFVGNPDLEPEDIHSFEAGYAYKNNGLTLVPTLFYRYKINGFTWVTTPVNDTVLETTIKNLDTDQSAGVDLSGSWNIASIANLNFSASGFYSQIDASDIGYSSHKSTFSWNAKLNASVSITKTTLFQLNGQYRSKALTAQGYREPTWVINLGLRQDLWKKKLSLIFTVSDLFNSQAWRNTIETEELVQESMRKRDGRVFYLGFLWNFGSNGKKTKEMKFEYDNGME